MKTGFSGAGSSSSRSLAATLFAVLAAASAAACISADPAAPDVVPPFLLRTGVIVDRARDAAFIAQPAGGVAAVDLGSGATRWTAAAAALPLAQNGRFVLAQMEEAQPGPLLRCAILDADDGAVVKEISVGLPAGVRALVSDTATHAFRATAEPDVEGFRVSWIQRERILLGIAPPRGLPVPERVQSGTLHIPLDSPSPLPTPPAPTVRASASGDLGGTLTLKRVDAVTGETLSESVVATSVIAFLWSAEGTDLLVSERVGKGTPDDPEYRWTIYSGQSGERIGELRRNTSAAPFFIAHGNIVFESQPHGYLSGEAWVAVPLQVVAAALREGNTTWTRAVRDLEYRGPTPPVR